MVNVLHTSPIAYGYVLLLLLQSVSVGSLTVPRNTSFSTGKSNLTMPALFSQSEPRQDFMGALFPFYADIANEAAENLCWSWTVRERPPIRPGYTRRPNWPPTVTEWYFLESICNFNLRSYSAFCMKYKDSANPEDVPRINFIRIDCPENHSCEHFLTRNFLGIYVFGAHCVPGDLMALYYNEVQQLQACSHPVVFINVPDAGQSHSQQRTLKLAINSRDERGKPKHAPLTWFEDLSPHRKVGQATRFGAQEWTAINGFSYIVTTYPVVIRFCGSAGSAVALHVWRQYNFYGAGLFADQMGQALTNMKQPDDDPGNGKLSRQEIFHSRQAEIANSGLNRSPENWSDVGDRDQRYRHVSLGTGGDHDRDQLAAHALQPRRSEHVKREWPERSFCNVFNRGGPPDAQGYFQILQEWTWIGSICSFVNHAKLHFCQCTYHYTTPQLEGTINLLDEPCLPGQVCRNFSLWHTNEVRAFCLPEGFEPEWSSDFDTDPGSGSGSGSGSNSGSGSGSGSGSNTGAAPQSDVSCSRRVTYDDERPAKRPRPGPGSGAGPSIRPQSQLHLSLESHQASTHFRDNVEELWFEVAREGERAVKVGQAFKHSVTTYVHVMAATTLVRFCARISKHHGRVPTLQFLGGGIVNPPSLQKRSTEDDASGPEGRLSRDVADRGKDVKSTRTRHEKKSTMTSRSKPTLTVTATLPRAPTIVVTRSSMSSGSQPENEPSHSQSS